MNDNGDNWNREQTLLLITELQKNPSLYNPLDVNYTSKGIRAKKFKLIVNALRKIKPSVSIEGIKSKIKTLRSQLWKENQKILNSQKSGCSADDVYKPKLWCFNELSFLLHKEIEPSTSNINLTEIGITEFKDFEISRHATLKEKKSNVSSQIEDNCINALNLTKTFMEEQLAKQPIGREEEFCRYLCSILNKIKIDENFDNLSLEILQLVNQKITEEKQQLTSEHNFSSIDLTIKNPTPISFGQSFNLLESQSCVNHLPPSPLKYTNKFQYSTSPRSEINSPVSIDTFNSLENMSRVTKSHSVTTNSYISQIPHKSPPLPLAQDYSNDTFQFQYSPSPSPQNHDQSNDIFQYPHSFNK